MSQDKTPARNGNAPLLAFGIEPSRRAAEHLFEFGADPGSLFARQVFLMFAGHVRDDISKNAAEPTGLIREVPAW